MRARRLAPLLAFAALAASAQAPAPTPEAPPAVAAGPEGFALRSADGAFQLRLRGYVQTDGRFFFDDEERPANDTFVLRRARPIVEGTLFRYLDFRIMPDFGGGQTALFDGYLEARFSSALRLRAGKFKPPLGLERLQSSTDLNFVERAAPTSLVPSRDVGVQLGGELASGRVEYALGVFNGVVDGGTGDGATGDGKELAARLFWRPFRPADGASSRHDLGVGLAASRGEQEGSVASPLLPTLRTAAQQSFFAYRSDATAEGTAFADGERTRLVPQAYWYSGPLGLVFEFARSEQRVRRDQAVRDLAHDAWQLQASWVLTGERNGWRGVSPRRPFEPGGEGRGAWMVAARYSVLDVDDATFPLFADSARAADEARLASVGASWNLSRGIRWLLEASLVEFDGGDPDGDRPDEKVLFTRFQVAF